MTMPLLGSYSFGSVGDVMCCSPSEVMGIRHRRVRWSRHARAIVLHSRSTSAPCLLKNTVQPVSQSSLTATRLLERAGTWNALLAVSGSFGSLSCIVLVVFMAVPLWMPSSLFSSCFFATSHLAWHPTSEIDAVESKNAPGWHLNY